MSWKNWGDHPVVVAIGIIGILSGLGYAIYDHWPKQENASENSSVSLKPPNSVVITPSISSSPTPVASQQSEADKKDKEYIKSLRKNILGKWKEVGKCPGVEEDRRPQDVSYDRSISFYENGSILDESRYKIVKTVPSAFIFIQEITLTYDIQISYAWYIEKTVLYTKVSNVSSINLVSASYRKDTGRGYGPSVSGYSDYNVGQEAAKIDGFMSKYYSEGSEEKYKILHFVLNSILLERIGNSKSFSCSQIRRFKRS